MSDPNDHIRFEANGRWAKLIPQIMTAVGGVALLTTFGVVVTAWYHQSVEYPDLKAKVELIYKNDVARAAVDEVQQERYKEAVANQQRLAAKLDLLTQAIHETALSNARDGH